MTNHEAQQVISQVDVHNEHTFHYNERFGYPPTLSLHDRVEQVVDSPVIAKKGHFLRL